MSLFSRLLAEVEPWLPPKSCFLCDAVCDDFLCADCVKQMQSAPLHCRFCSKPVQQADAVCGACLAKPPALDGLAIAYCFDAVVRDVVLAAKFGGNRAALEVMARTVADLPLPAVDVVVPLPMAQRRLLMRGFNQSVFLARAVSKRLCRPIQNEWLRKGWRRPQSLLSAAKLRRRNIRGAFTLQQSVSGIVLLVDDVYTTGATLNEAALTLKHGGVSMVYAVVFAAAFKEV